MFLIYCSSPYIYQLTRIPKHYWLFKLDLATKLSLISIWTILISTISSTSVVFYIQNPLFACSGVYLFSPPWKTPFLNYKIYIHFVTHLFRRLFLRKNLFNIQSVVTSSVTFLAFPRQLRVYKNTLFNNDPKKLTFKSGTKLFIYATSAIAITSMWISRFRVWLVRMWQ